jgi:putative component of membrane protein insertase Oxa1/YidC/SpoIIIJ protein YidD
MKFLTHCVNFVGQLFLMAMVGLVGVYRFFFSPMISVFGQTLGLPFSCKFPVSCSEFAEAELRQSKNVFRSLLKIFVRLIDCSPFQKEKLRVG